MAPDLSEMSNDDFLNAIYYLAGRGLIKEKEFADGNWNIQINANGIAEVEGRLINNKNKSLEGLRRRIKVLEGAPSQNLRSETIGLLDYIINDPILKDYYNKIKEDEKAFLKRESLQEYYEPYRSLLNSICDAIFSFGDILKVFKENNDFFDEFAEINMILFRELDKFEMNHDLIDKLTPIIGPPNNKDFWTSSGIERVIRIITDIIKTEIIGQNWDGNECQFLKNLNSYFSQLLQDINPDLLENNRRWFFDQKVKDIQGMVLDRYSSLNCDWDLGNMSSSIEKIGCTSDILAYRISDLFIFSRTQGNIEINNNIYHNLRSLADAIKEAQPFSSIHYLETNYLHNINWGSFHTRDERIQEREAVIFHFNRIINEMGRRLGESRVVQEIKSIIEEEAEIPLKYQLLVNEVILKGIKRSIELSKKCTPEDAKEPRPKVAAVVIKEGEIINEGFRGEFASGDHAEYTVLVKKKGVLDYTNAILITTLEPCTGRSLKHGKYPCAERIVQQGIAEIWIGIPDPNPAITDKGAIYLWNHHIKVNYFPDKYAKEIIDINRDFWDLHCGKYKIDLMSTSPPNPSSTEEEFPPLNLGFTQETPEGSLLGIPTVGFWLKYPGKFHPIQVQIILELFLGSQDITSEFVDNNGLWSGNLKWNLNPNDYITDSFQLPFQVVNSNEPIKITPNIIIFDKNQKQFIQLPQTHIYDRNKSKWTLLPSKG
ncbi:MAG TPA: hypothetical protein VMV49_14790 [Candidatus Deferrimicrobium sp.]|nr:hypothetical protein [Candidatus Deferrimicrobium sp.]